MNRLIAFAVCALLIAFSIPALSQDLDGLKSAEVVSAVSGNDTVHLTVKVVDIAGATKTWDHYLNAEELELWAKDKDAAVHRSYLTAADMLATEKAATQKQLDSPPVDVKAEIKNSSLDDAKTAVAKVRSDLEVLQAKPEPTEDEKKEIEELKKKMP